MKKLYISSIAATILATSVMADSSSINEAFKKGKVSGDISIYSQSVKNDTADSGYTMNSIGLGYKTDSYKGFNASLAFRANHKINEKESGDYSDGTDPEVAMSTANISYSTKGATIVAGRQEIDLEWIGDYHEAVVGVLKYVPQTTIIVGHTSRMMAVDDDGALGTMADIGTEGASVIDVKYKGIKDTTINPYFMDAKDVFSAYGLKVSTKVAGLGLTVHHAATSEDTAANDGAITHLEVEKKISDTTVKAGFVTTDKDGGIGSISALGDNIDPFEDGGATYTADSDTFYVDLSTKVSGYKLGAFYGSSSYGSSTDSEIVLKGEKDVAKNLSASVLLSSASYETSTNDTDKVSMQIKYKF